MIFTFCHRSGSGQRPGVKVVPIPVRWLVALLVTFAWLVPLSADTPKPPANDDCLACHGEPSTVRADGRPVVVNPAAFTASVHGTLGMACVDCHVDLARTTDFPHPGRLAPVNCATCHEKPAAEHSATVHGHARQAGAPAAACVDCHGMHDILPSSDPASRTYALNIPATCGRCHGPSGPPAALKVADEFRDSIHGRALLAKGLVVAPTCVSCHGAHDVRRHGDEHGKVARSQVVGTCTSCHQGIGPAYQASVHAQAVKAGNVLAPVCTDCHTAHRIAETSTDSWKLAIVRECGTCHESSLRTYRDTFHGKVSDLGYTRGQVRRLSRRTRDPARVESGVDHRARQAPPDLPDVPPERVGTLRAVRSARRSGRPEAEPRPVLHLAIHARAARRRVPVLRRAHDPLAATLVAAAARTP